MSSPLPAVPLSVLDLAPVGDGASASDAVQASLELARRADELGFTRFWLAEHHSMPGIASSAPAVLIGAVAAATRRIRVGSGGVMLPNHAPLVVAEQFGTLAALHPGRIDLGLGRAPGTDPRTAAALRRSADPLGPDDFPEQLGELACFLSGAFPEGHPYRQIRAVPQADAPPPIWLLGSSLYSAELAGLLGLPFAFAHHFSSAHTLPALERYRSSFRQGRTLDEPYAMVTVQAVCAPTDEEAERIALPAALSFLRLRQGQPGTLPTPEQAAEYPWSPMEREFVAQRRDGQAVGSPDTVRDALAALLKATGPDELMITTLVHSPQERLRSTELVRGLFAELPRGLQQT
ncbi:LLM class flavin-dependent oxidoreductase [Jatrophihabitans cynanchi]|jgi:luciferase family oxidoreductase group 1|uniref:LLM class flavin-dependent oxidoreductase n=1 Tax=Jatrophihabitans cynanchi TaxID=2944128 RepID=A0ABY7K2J8_9ACTN|nr:LLM class flavin-dependent oxidoreductase [Jatrophihabitans sp. SB3-54]WAX58728.1 LLM class flavin-dependent oxidoreductase [Jatrophihabitans sp. SB3-54]